MTKIKTAKIRNTFIYLNFKKWLENNIDRFSTRPYIERVERNAFTLAFQNVDNIKIVFSKSGSVNAYAIKDVEKKHIFTQENAELLTDFFFAEARDAKGYYCSFCEDPVYFNDRHSIWLDHVYEPLLKWANEKLVTTNYLCIYRGDGWGGTKILSNIQVNNDVMLKQRVFCKPIINKERIDEKA
jgi:hypothetical protein